MGLACPAEMELEGLPRREPTSTLRVNLAGNPAASAQKTRLCPLAPRQREDCGAPVRTGALSPGPGFGPTCCPAVGVPCSWSLIKASMHPLPRSANAHTSGGSVYTRSVPHHIGHTPDAIFEGAPATGRRFLPGNPQGSRPKETAAVLLLPPHTHQEQGARNAWQLKSFSRTHRVDGCEAHGWDETLL